MSSAQTGFGTAALRAIETETANSLIIDQFAKILAGETGANWVASLSSQTRNFMIDMLAVRTRLFDDLIIDFSSYEQPLDHFINRVMGQYYHFNPGLAMPQPANNKQIVILGAGLDTRAYRMSSLANLIVFEIDFAEVLDYKKRTLDALGIKPICKKHLLIPLDLSAEKIDSGLISEGFDLHIPTLWVMEALTGYLTMEENRSLISSISSLSARNSLIAGTFIGKTKKAFGENSTESTRHRFFTNNGADLFKASGWEAGQLGFSVFAKHYERDQRLSNYDYWIAYGACAQGKKTKCSY